VLAATALDYTFSGDYDYSIFKALREDATGIATPATYDYDYGQLQAIPQNAIATGRTSTTLDNEAGRYGKINGQRVLEFCIQIVSSSSGAAGWCWPASFGTRSSSNRQLAIAATELPQLTSPQW
jgi:hypothetical protein